MIQINTSLIWEELKNKFTINGTNQGYGINFSINKKHLLFNDLNKKIDLIFDFIFPSWVKKLMYDQIKMGLSFFIFRDKLYFKKYGLDYLKSGYNDELLKDFVLNSGIGYSHNSLKAFFYLRKIEKFISSPIEKPINVLEIGPGLFNFGYLLFTISKYSRINYVAIDLPNMIELLQIKVLNYNLNDVTIFSRSQIADYLECTCNKKLLLITTEDLDFKVGEFDLVVNHESFSEMNITDVNTYIDYISKLLKTDGLLFLVNRLLRVQNLNNRVSPNLDNITKFWDYNLDKFATKYLEKDEFRDLIPSESSNPNFIYIGQKIESTM